MASNNYSPFVPFESLLESPFIFAGSNEDCTFIATDSKIIWPMSTNSATIYDVGDDIVGAFGDIQGEDIVVTDLASLTEKSRLMLVATLL